MTILSNDAKRMRAEAMLTNAKSRYAKIVAILSTSFFFLLLAFLFVSKTIMG
ncbi:hypothetical protein REC12_06390 [Desulfosporosinus sp. PR]|nr:hypothetical protein [Desulfosporosinus sp. PR]